jgi:two-component system, OmpR family, sensor histidine kinase SenX3
MRYRPSVQLVVAGVLAGLLLLLGTLQWRWLGQISADERERMQTALGSQLREFTQDFDRELTRAYFWLQVDRTATPGIASHDSTQHFQRWLTSAPDPQIVSRIYTVNLPDDPASSALELERYDPDLEQLVPVTEVPPNLRDLMGRLADLPRQDATVDRNTPPPAMLSPVQSDVPALLIPRPPVPITVSPEGTIVFSQADRPWDFTIAELDLDYIRDSHIPDLLARQFGALAELPYELVVTDEESDTPVFCLNRREGDCVIANPDVSRTFFDLRMREFNRFVVVDDRRGPPRSPADADPSSVRRGGPSQEGPGRGVQDDQRGEVRSRARAVPPPGGPGPGGPPTVASAGPSARPGDDPRPGPGPLWRVDVRHAAGSLEAAVSSTRRRNLIVSSSVLGLLGASVGLLVLSSGRARRLAAQQMEFVAGVSHELRTPLAVIRAAGENLADGVVHDGSQVQQYGKLIADEGRRLTEMVEQVMEFAGFDAGRTLDMRPTAVRDIVDTVVAASQPLVQEHGASIEVTVADDVTWVRANHAAFGRTLHNLISNAVKYGGDDRWVGLSVVRAARDMVAFRVSDHGHGIPEQDLPHIFEPFYRGEPAVDGHVHGAGLGLSLVARVVQQHGGRVLVDSTPERGTTFTVLVPATRGVVHPAGEAAPASDALTALRSASDRGVSR